MTTTASKEIVPNFGMGLTVYVSGDYWPMRTGGNSVEKYLEDLIKIPFVQKVYIRLNWCNIQSQPGKLEFPEAWKQAFAIAKKYGKRMAFRVMLENPDYPDPGMPKFLREKVPYVTLKGEWRTKDRNYPKGFKMPRYDLPAYQAAFTELNEMLANEFNGHPDVEYVDAFMYGFWGEGHTWPFTSHPFPDDATAEKTWIKMFEIQLRCWTKTPLATNTQPDWSRVGNSELIARTIRSNNWLRTDSIFIENEQIEALSNRPSWIAAISEVGMTTGRHQRFAYGSGRDGERKYYSARNGHRRQLLVGVELAQHFGAPHPELLRKISDTDRYPRPLHRVSYPSRMDLVV